MTFSNDYSIQKVLFSATLSNPECRYHGHLQNLY